MDTSNWKLPRVTDYFDNRNYNSLLEFTLKIDTYPDNERQEILQAISQRVLDYMIQMKKKSKEIFLNVIWIVADDIYRALNMTDVYTNTMEDYLRAAARPIFKYLAEVGISVHYLTNNTYEHWLKPVKYFPSLYQSFGFVYICPLYTAQHFMIIDGKDPKDFDLLYKNYHKEAIMVNNELIEECHKNNRHYILLIPDGNQEDFKLSFEMINKKGVQTIFREEAPQDSAKVMLFSDNVI